MQVSRSKFDMESQRGLTEVGVKRTRELVSSGSSGGDRESSGLTKMTSSSSSSSAYSRSRTAANNDNVGIESGQTVRLGSGSGSDSRSASPSTVSRDQASNGNSNGFISSKTIIPTSPAGGGSGGGSATKVSSSIDTTSADEELYPMFINEAGDNTHPLLTQLLTLTPAFINTYAFIYKHSPSFINTYAFIINTNAAFINPLNTMCPTAYNEKDVAFVLMRRTERIISIITADLQT